MVCRSARQVAQHAGGAWTGPWTAGCNHTSCGRSRTSCGCSRTSCGRRSSGGDGSGRRQWGYNGSRCGSRCRRRHRSRARGENCRRRRCGGQNWGRRGTPRRQYCGEGDYYHRSRRIGRRKVSDVSDLGYEFHRRRCADRRRRWRWGSGRGSSSGGRSHGQRDCGGGERRRRWRVTGDGAGGNAEDDRGEGLGISGDHTRLWLDVARERDRRRRRDGHPQRDCVVIAARRACLGQEQARHQSELSGSDVCQQTRAMLWGWFVNRCSAGRDEFGLHLPDHRLPVGCQRTFLMITPQI